MKGEGLLTIYIQFVKNIPFFISLRTRGSTLHIFWRKKINISTIKEESLFLHVVKTDKHEEKAAD